VRDGDGLGVRQLAFIAHAVAVGVSEDDAVDERFFFIGVGGAEGVLGSEMRGARGLADAAVFFQARHHRVVGAGAEVGEFISAAGGRAGEGLAFVADSRTIEVKEHAEALEAFAGGVTDFSGEG
jgi:hypothetical protein